MEKMEMTTAMLIDIMKRKKFKIGEKDSVFIIAFDNAYSSLVGGCKRTLAGMLMYAILNDENVLDLIYETAVILKKDRELQEKFLKTIESMEKCEKTLDMLLDELEKLKKERKHNTGKKSPTPTKVEKSRKSKR